MASRDIDMQVPGLPGPSTVGGFGPQSYLASAGLQNLGGSASMGPGQSAAAGSQASLLLSTMTLSDSSSGYFFNSGLDCRNANGSRQQASVDNRCVWENSDSSPPYWLAPNTQPRAPDYIFNERPPTFQPINPF